VLAQVGHGLKFVGEGHLADKDINIPPLLVPVPEMPGRARVAGVGEGVGSVGNEKTHGLAVVVDSYRFHFIGIYGKFPPGLDNMEIYSRQVF